MNRLILANAKLCVGCDACVDACAEAHKNVGLQAQSRMTIVRNGDVATPITCRQCENAPCAQICPVGAITMGESSIDLNEAKCIGCKLCAFVCPFGVIGFSTSKGDADGQEDARTVAVKCDLCASSANGPECVKACATNALFLVDAKALRKSSNAKRKASVSNMPAFTDDSVG